MTKYQENAVNRIRNIALSEFRTTSGDYEIKEFKVDENEYFVSLVCVVGLVGDEGKLTSIYCRDRIHLFIGKRGGITYPVTNKRGEHIRRELGRHSLYHVAYEQKYM